MSAELAMAGMRFSRRARKLLQKVGTPSPLCSAILLPNFVRRVSPKRAPSRAASIFGRVAPVPVTIPNEDEGASESLASGDRGEIF